MIRAVYEQLPDDIKRVLVWWIEEYVRPANSVNYRHSSYGLKHLFHSSTQIYVTNDEFKGAMLAHGYGPVNPSDANWHYAIQDIQLPRRHQPEAHLEKRFSHEVAKRGGKAIKFTPPGWAGAPDRLVLIPGGRVVFVEFKAYGERPRPLQEQRHQELRKLGFDVRVVDCEEECLAFLEEFFDDEVRPS